MATTPPAPMPHGVRIIRLPHSRDHHARFTATLLPPLLPRRPLPTRLRRAAPASLRSWSSPSSRLLSPSHGSGPSAALTRASTSRSWKCEWGLREGEGGVKGSRCRASAACLRGGWGGQGEQVCQPAQPCARARRGRAETRGQHRDCRTAATWIIKCLAGSAPSQAWRVPSPPPASGPFEPLPSPSCPHSAVTLTEMPNGKLTGLLVPELPQQP